MSNRIYLVTGAAGFLGSNICLQLLEKGEKVRALVLPNDKSVKYIPKDVEICLGDLCDEKSLDDLTVSGGTLTPAFDKNKNIFFINILSKTGLFPPFKIISPYFTSTISFISNSFQLSVYFQFLILL